MKNFVATVLGVCALVLFSPLLVWWFNPSRNRTRGAAAIGGGLIWYLSIMALPITLLFWCLVYAVWRYT